MRRGREKERREQGAEVSPCSVMSFSIRGERTTTRCCDDDDYSSSHTHTLSSHQRVRCMCVGWMVEERERGGGGLIDFFQLTEPLTAFSSTQVREGERLFVGVITYRAAAFLNHLSEESLELCAHHHVSLAFPPRA